MGKLLTGLALLITATNTYAICSTLTKTWDQGAKQNQHTLLYSHSEYNITNQTNCRQAYQICYEFSAQMYDHSRKFTTAFCENITLEPGQSSGSVKRDPTLDVIYPSAARSYYVAIDSIVEIKGQCQSIAHDAKKLQVY